MKISKKALAMFLALMCVIFAVGCGKKDIDKETALENSTQNEQDSTIEDSVHFDDLFEDGEDTTSDKDQSTSNKNEGTTNKDEATSNKNEGTSNKGIIT